MTQNQIYAITGANRGIGLGLVLAYLARPSTTVIGIVRSAKAAESLLTSSRETILGDNSHLYIAEVPTSVQASPEAFRAAILSTIPNAITTINALICSAGWSPSMVPTLSVSINDLQECFQINTIGPLIAIQALWPLLQPCPDPKFIVLTSSVGSISAMEPFPGAPYGPSKTAVNWIVRSLHLQHENLISVALHPGWVQTRMGEQAARDWGYEPGPPLTVEESVNGIVGVVDGASREKYAGKFVKQTGDEIPW
jgi:NAD(P)-dependent dehydrogenase (short-subunit alcohol dehydrogenase family)